MFPMLQKDYDMEVNYNCDDFTEAYVQDQKSILLQLKIRGILKLTYEKSTFRASLLDVFKTTVKF